MLLTKKQQLRFWSEWATVKSQFPADLSASDFELERHNLLERAGFTSLKFVDPLTGFDRVLQELALLRSDLSGHRRAADMEKTRLIYAIRKLDSQLSAIPFRKRSETPVIYAAAIARDRFGTTDLESLNVEQLTQLRNTLQARLHTKRQKSNAASALVAEAPSDTSDPSDLITAH